MTDKMIIKTAIKPEEDLDLLCNSLNAQAGRFSYSDPALRNYLLRAQAAINSLCEILLKEQEAVKPTLIREGRNKNYNDYVCPRCDNEVVYEQNYCSECGVRFLWKGSDGNEP